MRLLGWWQVAEITRPWPTNAAMPRLDASVVRNAQDFYRTTNIWLAHLRFTREQWKALELKRIGKPVPAAPTAWRWRFAGLVLGIAGALGLMFRLPELHPRLARTRRWIVPAVLLIALILTLGPWVGVTPQLRRIPQQLVLLVVIWLALAGFSRLRMPRWSLALVTGILALGCLALRMAYATKPVRVVVPVRRSLNLIKLLAMLAFGKAAPGARRFQLQSLRMRVESPQKP